MREYFLFAVSSCLMLAGCAASAPPTVYEPASNGSVYSFYKNGYALGTAGNDSCRVIAELEPSKVAGRQYMRLWLLYYNSSNSPFLLDPVKAARLTASQSNGDTIELGATPPYKILASIDNQKTIAIIAQAIGGVAEAMQQRPTSITNTWTGEQWQVNDTKEKTDMAVSKTNASIVTTSMIFDLYKQSVIAGIFRRNTIFPRQSVTGYIYFSLPYYDIYDPDAVHFDDYPDAVHVEIFTQGGQLNFDFRRVKGE